MHARTDFRESSNKRRLMQTIRSERVLLFICMLMRGSSNKGPISVVIATAWPICDRIIGSVLYFDLSIASSTVICIMHLFGRCFYPITTAIVKDGLENGSCNKVVVIKIESFSRQLDESDITSLSCLPPCAVQLRGVTSRLAWGVRWLVWWDQCRLQTGKSRRTSRHRRSQ